MRHEQLACVIGQLRWAYRPELLCRRRDLQAPVFEAGVLGSVDVEDPLLRVAGNGQDHAVCASRSESR